jgi:hypothetical protein
MKRPDTREALLRLGAGAAAGLEGCLWLYDAALAPLSRAPLFAASRVPGIVHAVVWWEESPASAADEAAYPQLNADGSPSGGTQATPLARAHAALGLGSTPERSSTGADKAGAAGRSASAASRIEAAVKNAVSRPWTGALRGEPRPGDPPELRMSDGQSGRVFVGGRWVSIRPNPMHMRLMEAAAASGADGAGGTGKYTPRERQVPLAVLAVNAQGVHLLQPGSVSTSHCTHSTITHTFN